MHNAVWGILFLIAAMWFFNDPFDPDKVKGRRVIITGSSTGIGADMARHYCRLGAKVVLTARNLDRLNKVADECRKLGGEAHVVTADMKERDAPVKVHKLAVEKLGGLDQVVLNHMLPFEMGRWTGAENLTMLEDSLTVNVVAYIHLASLSLPQLRASSGGITVLNSISGLIPVPLCAAYVASKHALTGFFRTLHLEFVLAQVPVSVTSCHLGFIATAPALRKMSSFDITRFVPAENVSDTALAVLKAGETKQLELFYPRSGQMVAYLRDWTPQFVWNFYASLYRS